MNDRKQQVITKAHELFIEKGFQATSILDILEYSGISKGTFYNYFSSKNELLIAIFTSLNKRIDQERNELLLGQDPSDIKIFIHQLELQMEFNRRNKLLTLFEEVFVSNDPALKQFLKRTQIMHIRWIFNRFVDIFGKSNQPYLLDCAIMFTGMLHHNIHFHFLAYEMDGNMNQVIHYTVERMQKMVEEVARNRSQLLKPEILDKWLPNCDQSGQAFKKKVYNTVSAVKNCLGTGDNRLEMIELLDFIQEEVIHSKTPRKFLIQSALSSIRENSGTLSKLELQKLEQIVDDFFSDKENA